MEAIFIPSIAQLKSYLKENYPCEIIYEKNQHIIPKYLFRGEVDNTWTETTSSFGRFVEKYKDEGCSRYAEILYRSAYRGLRGIDGYTISPEEGIALLQHYGMPTPQIDLTGNIDVAIFFATENIGANLKPIIQIIDVTQISDDLEIVDHAFLTTKDKDAISKHRYVRQDGFAIFPKEYKKTDIARTFDLKAPEFQKFVKTVSFSPIDQENIILNRDYIYDPNDFLAPKIKYILEQMIIYWEMEMDMSDDENTLPICNELKKKIGKIYPF